MTPAKTAVTKTLLLLTQSLCVSTVLICPSVSYLETVIQLICTGGGIFHSYTNPRGVDVAQCSLFGGPCDPLDAPVTVINNTQTIFNIPSVQIEDVGTWSCKPGLEAPGTCDLVAARTPTCSITSKEDTDVLALYQELTLTVDTQDYYCSTALTFSLQTGKVTTLLMAAESVASVTHSTSSVTLNVTDSHMGVVRLIFSCHNERSSLPCDGVTELKTTDPPGNDEPSTPSTLIIIAAVVCAIVFLVIIIIIVCVVKRKQVNEIKQQSPVNPHRPPHINVGQLGGADYATVEVHRVA